MNAMTKPPTESQLLEDVVIRGDLSKLTEAQRNEYYFKVCDKLGLNPLTLPLSYIVLNSKLTLYVTRGATDQLRSIRGISVEEMEHSESDGILTVTVKVRELATNRTDMSTGVISLGHLKGEALCNARMKAETKAKRRATLSLCGLGLLDEMEVDDIPVGAKAPAPPPQIGKNIPENIPPHDPETGEVIDHADPVEHDGVPAFLDRRNGNGKPTLEPIPVPEKDDGTPNWINWAQAYIAAAKTTDVETLADANASTLATMGKDAPVGAPIAKRRMFAAIHRNKQEAGQ